MNETQTIEVLNYCIFRENPESGLYAVMHISPSEFPYYPTALVYSFRRSMYHTVSWNEKKVSLIDAKQFDFEPLPVVQYIAVGPCGFAYGKDFEDAILHLLRDSRLEDQTIEMHRIEGLATVHFGMRGTVHPKGEATVEKKKLELTTDDPYWDMSYDKFC